jgi:hypothetical protein
VGPARWLVVRAKRGGGDGCRDGEREEEARSCRQEFVAILRRRPPKIPAGDARMRSFAAAGPARTARSLVDLTPPSEPQMRRCPSRRKSGGGWRGAAREEGRDDVSSLHLRKRSRLPGQ